MRVLVTGASGMLGAGVARELASRGDEVTVLQRRPSGLGLPEVLADLADPGCEATLRTALDGCDGVVHLAAKVDVVGREAAYVAANVAGTRRVVDACRAAGVSRLVHVFSAPLGYLTRPYIVYRSRDDQMGSRAPKSGWERVQ